MTNIHPNYLLKNQDEQAYKKFAEQGMDLMYPVRVKGRTHRPDINIPYHATIKLFDTTKDKPEQVHETASKLPLNPPDPKQIHIEPTTLKGREGNLMHVIRLHGPHANDIKEHHKKFSHLGYKENYEYSPHITVDKPFWDHVVHSKAKTAHDAGIQFMPAELHHGHKVVASYKPKAPIQPGGEVPKDDKLAASEDLEKSVFRNLGTAATMGAALASASASAPTYKPEPYSSQRMLNAISQVESSGGKNKEHAAGGGPIHGQEHAYGKFGLMPETIRETIKMNRDIAHKHGKAARLKGPALSNYMQHNPGLEDTIAQRHLSRLEHHFGQNPQDIGYSWLNGISGTYNAKKQNKDIGNHWHVKKIKEAYSRGK